MSSKHHSGEWLKFKRKLIRHGFKLDNNTNKVSNTIRLSKDDGPVYMLHEGELAIRPLSSWIKTNYQIDLRPKIKKNTKRRNRQKVEIVKKQTVYLQRNSLVSLPEYAACHQWERKFLRKLMSSIRQRYWEISSYWSIHNQNDILSLIKEEDDPFIISDKFNTTTKLVVEHAFKKDRIDEIAKYVAKELWYNEE